MPDLTIATVDDALSADGALAQHIQGFIPRESQRLMAEAVTEALQNNSLLICEAGTGTGKTFAYLIPALLSDQKVIVSTGTKNLQDQLFQRDLPILLKALKISAKVALLKGRANYLCRERLEMHQKPERFWSPELIHELQQVKSWSTTTKTGDLSEMTQLSDESPVFPYVTSTADNCLGQECPHFKDCYLVKARREAQDADLVVVNHHLFFADRKLREEGFGELLPGASAVIFDEAHQLYDIASQFFGISISSRQLTELAYDIKTETKLHANDVKELLERADDLIDEVKKFHRVFGENNFKVAWQEYATREEIKTAIQENIETLTLLNKLLETHSARSKELEKCWKRGEELKIKLMQLTNTAPPDQIHWLENRPRSFSLHFTPLDVAKQFAEFIRERPCAWIFTSATLSVGTDFTYFSERLGLKEVKQMQLLSPFDYKQQALLYIPLNMPQPNDKNYIQAVVHAAIPVLRITKGRAFFLFTSHKALQEAAYYLEQQIDYPLLIQGKMPRSSLLAKFRQQPQSILLGSYSFWEGVDVRGNGLTCVIIDKLPFAAPSDPILKAKVDAIRKQGKDPFNTLQIPSAVINLKQGVGRLIRDVTDYGVLMIADPRLIHSSYGRFFMNNIPPSPIVREVKKVEEFFNKHETVSA